MTPRAKARRAAIYTRISLDRTGDSLSPERQETLCRQLAEAKGWEVARVYSDRDRSGWQRSVKRPGFEQMQAAISAGDVNAVVAYSLSRVSRRAVDLHHLLEFLDDQGAVLALYDQQIDTATAAGRMFFGVVASLAEMESAQTSERVKSAHSVAAEAGRMHGGPRQYGYRRDPETKKYLGVHEEEAAIVREVATRIVAGESLRQIAFDLNKRGVKTAPGGEWFGSSLRRMILSPRLTGLRVYKGTAYEGDWEPILDRDEHARVIAALTSTPAARKEAQVHLLTGLLHCGNCGGMLRITKWREKSGNSYPRYHCFRQPGNNFCGRLTASQAGVDDVVLDKFFEVMSSSKLRPVDDGAGKAEALRVAIEGDEKEEVRLTLDHYVNRTMTRDAYTAALAALHARQDANRAVLAALEAQQKVVAGALRPGKREDLEAWWEKATVAERRAALRAAIREVVVLPAKRKGGRPFDTSRVRVSWRWSLYARVGKAWEKNADVLERAEVELATTMMRDDSGQSQHVRIEAET